MLKPSQIREYNQAGWKGEIRNFRIQIRDLLADSPSLTSYLRDILDKCYQDAVKIVADKMKRSFTSFPFSPIANLEQILDDNWLSL